jgi:hypothetical protein
MAKQIINLGSSELAGDGESIRSAFDKVNKNFTELYIPFKSWQIARSDYVAQNGDRIIADTTDGSFTITLPQDPQEGFHVEIADGGNFAENNLLLISVQPVEGFDQDIIFDIKGLNLEFVYVGSVWRILTALGVKGDKGDPGDLDLTAYATKEYVDNAIAAIASVDGGNAASEYDDVIGGGEE